MLSICHYGDPILRKTALSVENFDEGLAQLVEEMLAAMREMDGVGLAAPQVGEAVRVMIVDTTHGVEAPYVFVNPEIIYASEELEKDEEGCLSLPDINVPVNRAARVSVKAQNIRGEVYTIENADGLLARALQHEIDHLNGKLLIDHATPVQRALLNGKLKKISKARG